MCNLPIGVVDFFNLQRIDLGPEWVKFPCSCPSFLLSIGYSCLNRLGLFAALGPLQPFSGGWFVRWQ